MSKIKYLILLLVNIFGMTVDAIPSQEPLSWEEVFAAAESAGLALIPLSSASLRDTACVCIESAGVGFSALSVLKQWEEQQLSEIQSLIAEEYVL